MGKLNRLKKGSCILLVGILISTVLPMNSVAQEPMNSDRIIVSLGDSYSSGEGIEEFFGQNKELNEKISNYDWLAHRSQNAWSGMLTLSGVSGNMSENRNRNWYFVASSGAEIKHLYEEQVKTYYKSASGEISKITVRGAKRNYIKPYYGSVDLPEQLSIFDTLKEEGKCADYITMTIGGNDADFSKIITKAVVGTYFNVGGLADKLEDVWDKFEEKGGIRDSLYNAYEEVLNKAGEQAHLIVVGYPKLLEQAGEGLPINHYEAAIINTAVVNFNIEIREIVEDCRDNKNMKISFVDIKNKFDKHEAYSENPYIHEVILGSEPEDISDNLIASAYSMHPNYEGACKYAECVQEEINRLEELYGYSDYYKVKEEDYFEFLAKHPEYNYYAFLDVNNDGNIEMLAAKELYDTGEMLASYYSYIDLFAYKNGKIDRVHEDIWTKFFNLMYDEENNWIVTTIDGPNGAGYEIISLDSKCDTRVQRIERYDYDKDEAGSKSVQLYYNDEEVKPEKQAKYEELWGKVQDGSSEEISFESVFENTNSSLNKSNSVEEQVKEIKQIYTGIQNNLDSYTVEDGGGDTTRYVENGKIRKIVTSLHTYDDSYNENIEGYTAEYYYEDDAVVYVVVHSDYDIYRYYVEKGNYTNCIRYIDEYGTVYDYPNGIPSYEINELGEFCTLAMQELHWAGVF